jgi:hypothetical protein
MPRIGWDVADFLLHFHRSHTSSTANPVMIPQPPPCCPFAAPLWVVCTLAAPLWVICTLAAIVEAPIVRSVGVDRVRGHEGGELIGRT